MADVEKKERKAGAVGESGSERNMLGNLRDFIMGDSTAAGAKKQAETPAERKARMQQMRAKKEQAKEEQAFLQTVNKQVRAQLEAGANERADSTEIKDVD